MAAFLLRSLVTANVRLHANYTFLRYIIFLSGKTCQSLIPSILTNVLWLCRAACRLCLKTTSKISYQWPKFKFQYQASITAYICVKSLCSASFPAEPLLPLFLSFKKTAEGVTRSQTQFIILTHSDHV